MCGQTGTAPQDGHLDVLLANHRRFLSFLEKRVGNRQDAEEILQNAYVRSIEKSDQIRESENVVAWFYRLLRNAVIDKYRHDDVARRSIEAVARESELFQETADPETERVLCECVKDLVSVLRPNQASLIDLVDIQNLDVTSVADQLGISAGHARVRLHRARSALRKEVEKTCRTCATHGCVDCSCSRKPPE